MSNRTKNLIAVALLLMTSGLWSMRPAIAAAQERFPYLTEPSVQVSRLGAVRAGGMVDCSADVLAMWPDYVGAPEVVLTNVSWTANQRKGRSVLTARFEDAMASPCWARPGAQWVEPDRCRLHDDGTLHPCKWDTNNYGSDGWVFGNGVFKTGATHLTATMDGGYYWFPGDEEDQNLRSFEITGWDVAARGPEPQALSGRPRRRSGHARHGQPG